jgi:hypothetical protein
MSKKTIALLLNILVFFIMVGCVSAAVSPQSINEEALNQEINTNEKKIVN